MDTIESLSAQMTADGYQDGTGDDGLDLLDKAMAALYACCGQKMLAAGFHRNGKHLSYRYCPECKRYERI